MLRLTLAIILFAGSLNLIIANESLSAQQPRECYSCTGFNCQRLTKLNETVMCKDVLDICVTIFDRSTVVAKGCYLDMPVKLRSKCDERDNASCYKCFGQMCNNKARTDAKCIQCNSRQNAKCASAPADIAPTQCSVPTAYNTYCYVRGGSDGVISRGCAVHEEEQMDCMTDPACRICLLNDAEGCNAFNIDTQRSAAGKNAASISLLAVMLISFSNLMH